MGAPADAACRIHRCACLCAPATFCHTAYPSLFCDTQDDDPWVAGAGSRQAAPHAADEVAPRCPSPTLDHLVGSAPPLGTLPELRDVRAAAAAPQQQHAGELRLAAGGAHACGASSNGAARPLMGRGEEGMNVEGLGTGVLPGAAEPRHTEESAASDSVDAEAVRREMEAAGLADELHHPHAPEGVVVARQGAGVGVGELHGHGQ